MAAALVAIGTAAWSGACGGPTGSSTVAAGATDGGDSSSDSPGVTVDPSHVVALHSQTSGFSVTQQDGTSYSLVLRTGDLQDPHPGASVALLGPGETDTDRNGTPTFTPSLYLPVGSQCHDITAGKDKVLPFAVTVVGQGDQAIQEVGIELNPGQNTGLLTSLHIELEQSYEGDASTAKSSCGRWADPGTGDTVGWFQPTGATPPFPDSTMAGFLVLKDYQAHQADFAKLSLEIAPSPGLNAKGPETLSKFTGGMKADDYRNVLGDTVMHGGMVPLLP